MVEVAILSTMLHKVNISLLRAIISPTGLRTATVIITTTQFLRLAGNHLHQVLEIFGVHPRPRQALTTTIPLILRIVGDKGLLAIRNTTAASLAMGIIRETMIDEVKADTEGGDIRHYVLMILTHYVVIVNHLKRRYTWALVYSSKVWG